MTSPHLRLQPEGLPPGRGYSHAVSAEAGRTVWIAGQVGADATGDVTGSWLDQFDRALGNVVIALRAGGAEPGHVVAMQVFTTAMDGYRAAVPRLGELWRHHMGRHYPAMAVVGVTELVDPNAVVEIMVTAVVPGG